MISVYLLLDCGEQLEVAKLQPYNWSNECQPNVQRSSAKCLTVVSQMSDGRLTKCPTAIRPIGIYESMESTVWLFAFVLYTFNAHESFNVPTTDYFH